MMSTLEIQAERHVREMNQRDFGYYLALIMHKERPYTPSEVSHWETGRRPVPAAVESALLGKRYGWMGLQRLYVIGGDGGSFKIGRSMLPEWRCQQFRWDTKRDLEVIFEAYCVDAAEAERLAIEKLQPHLSEGREWFNTTPLEAIAAVASAVHEVNTYTVVGYFTDEQLAQIDAARGSVSRSDFVKAVLLEMLHEEETPP